MPNTIRTKRRVNKRMKQSKWTPKERFLFTTQKLRASTIPNKKKKQSKESSRTFRTLYKNKKHIQDY